MRSFPDWIQPGIRALHAGHEPCTILKTMPDSSGMCDVMIRFDVPHERLGADYAVSQTMLKPE
jgi:hypothetical protein